MFVVIFHFATNDVCIVLLIWRSRNGWFDERETCTKKLRRRWRHGPNTSKPGGGLGGVAYKDRPPPPPPAVTYVLACSRQCPCGRSAVRGEVSTTARHALLGLPGDCADMARRIIKWRV